jgi:Tfp pilus assembly protein PilF
MRSKNLEKAMYFLQKALQHNPELVNAWLGLASVYYIQNQYQIAYQHLKRYEMLCKQCTPSAIKLGINITKALNLKKEAQQYALQLKAYQAELLKSNSILID